MREVVRMYARSTTMRGDASRVDEGIAMVRDEIAPAVREMDGCIGLSLLVDRGTGTSIVTSAWDSEEAMRASAQGVEPLRRRGAETLSATPEVREWEIAVLHREHAAPEGACASVTWTRGDPAHIDRNLQAFRDEVMPRIQELDGFCSLSLFLDRQEGRGVTATVFRDRAALDSAQPAIQQIREGALDQFDLELVDVAELEVAYAHLRVPETV
jgi:quinol monooxygenase YgiN